MASDVNVTVYNKTRDFQNIVIFQQKDDLDQMFNNLFPIAWKVFPLNGVEDGVAKKGMTVYPVKQTIGVVRQPAKTDKLPYGTLEITRKAENSEQLKYFLDQNSAQNITLLSGQNDDSSISCLNEAPELVTIAFAKDNATLVAQINVANGDKAVFQLTPKLYFMYLNNIKEGDIFKSMQTGTNVKEVDLTGYTSITASLEYTGGAGQQKGWKIEAR
ncbi:hypothetical protein QUA00_32235 [Microcoleus sp. T2B6]|uniref:hypothetical protein n=1 Tax=Microcoleus sp. T2B6 TaxID=3055424 RepID=UPI002FD001B1